ncbi:MAG: hypothetical protein M1832_001855 [Thelocarpon impressellum]|nr:MAG: hypothetical protein M1832_001855 [Thelocarpon impressellum]
MPTTIKDLPPEILFSILERGADLNAKDAAVFTYGLTAAPQPLQKVHLERYVRGRRPPDALRWSATDAVRRVNRRWHDWALDYSLRELWVESGALEDPMTLLSGIAVYRDSFRSLKKTIDLFSRYPGIAAYVRRIWFNGFFVAETDSYIFRILRHCINLQSATLPWTSIRRGNAEDWSTLLSRTALSSLELLAVDLKDSQKSGDANQRDERPLHDCQVEFGCLTRLKLSGDSDFMPVTDDDLRAIAKTATNLEEIHVTGTSSVTVDGKPLVLPRDDTSDSVGVLALAKASSRALRVLEFSPSRLTSSATEDHPCAMIPSLPHLVNLSTSIPYVCPQLFSAATVRWAGEVQVRAAGLCRHGSLQGSGLREVVGTARSLMGALDVDGANLEIEISIGKKSGQAVEPD